MKWQVWSILEEFIYQSWKDMPDGKNVSDEEHKKLLQYGHSYQYDKDELIDIFDQAGLQIEKYNISDENNHNIVLICNDFKLGMP